MKWRAVVIPAMAGLYVWWGYGTVVSGDWLQKARNWIAPRMVRVVASDMATPPLVGGLPVHWPPRRRITVSIDASVDGLGRGSSDTVMDAMGTWLGSGAPLPDVAFDAVSHRQPPTEADGMNGVYAAPIDVPGHEHDPAVTILRVMEATGEIAEADVILNASHRWARVTPTSGAGRTSGRGPVPGCSGTYDVQGVATHEFGHFLGLPDERGDRRAAMYRETPACTIDQRNLAPTDRSAITAVYDLGGPGDGGGRTAPVASMKLDAGHASAEKTLLKVIEEN